MTAPSAAATPPTQRPPQSATRMFWVFTRLALQGFGGVLAVAQRELVERERWLSKDDFLALLSIGQVLPGPNIVNMALILGQRFFGWRGAAASVLGLMAAPMVIVLLLAASFTQISAVPAVAGALRGMGVVAAGLVISTALKLASPLRRNAMGLPLCVAFVVLTFAAIGVMRWPMAWVVLGLGGVAMGCAAVKLRR
jgi:chromate transporter